MSQKYDNTNRGVLFKNDRKETDNHPDYTGRIDIDGTEYFLSAWIKDGRNGKFMSLSRGTRVEEAVSKAKQTAQPSEPFADDIPFVPVSSKF